MSFGGFFVAILRSADTLCDMYAYLSGIVLELEDGRLVIKPEGMGVGYEVLVTSLTIGNSRVGESKELFIHHHITDVSEALFGFESLAEKAVFRKLLKVSGVGGKTALSLLSIGMLPLVRAIETGDEKVLGSVSGIGKKTALKIIVELAKEVSTEDIMSE
ncbi:MAG: Holliday junction branch migration protein RuvA [Patescibacteria group bacterium]